MCPLTLGQILAPQFEPKNTKNDHNRRLRLELVLIESSSVHTMLNVLS